AALSRPPGTLGGGSRWTSPPGVWRACRTRMIEPAPTSSPPARPPFTLETIATIPQDGYFLQFVREGEHTGTHWGAPGHFNEGEVLADQMDPADLFLPAVKIDVRDKSRHNADYGVTIDDI